MVGELFILILLNKTAQKISTKMYCVLSNKILQEAGTTSKMFSRFFGTKSF